MRQYQAKYTMRQLLPYRIARKIGWLPVCVMQFLAVIPLSTILIAQLFWRAMQAFAEECKEDFSDVHFLAFLHPQWRDAEKDNLVAEASEALKRNVSTDEVTK